MILLQVDNIKKKLAGNVSAIEIYVLTLNR